MDAKAGRAAIAGAREHRGRDLLADHPERWPKRWTASPVTRKTWRGSIKQLSFCGVKLVRLAEGEISELHVGLKGTMNALFLKDLALKTRRVLEGRICAGRSGGGLCYGYSVVRQLVANGEADTGLRQINEVEASIVRRIFAEFAAGKGPRAIARDLNSEVSPGPEAVRGAILRSAVTPSAVLAFSTTSSTQDGSSGTNNDM